MSEPLSDPGALRIDRSPADVTPAAVVDLPPRWPAVVRAELVRRHRLLLDRASTVAAGPVLDLSLPEQRQQLREVMSSPDPTAAAAALGSFGAVMSVAGLCRLADLGSALRVVASMLVPDGEVWLVEPGFAPGLAATLVASGGALLPPARGVHLARDVPATVRSVGLRITDVERFTMSTSLWPLRRFTELRAVKFGRPDGGVS